MEVREDEEGRKELAQGEEASEHGNGESLLMNLFWLEEVKN